MPSASLARSPGANAPGPRVRLARLALASALRLPDVVGGEAGPAGLRVTADAPGGLLRGVSVTAQADGRYAVDLRLVVAMVPLAALADEVRRRVQASAERERLDGELGVVNVEFARVLTPEEVARERGPGDAAAPPAPGLPARAPEGPR